MNISRNKWGQTPLLHVDISEALTAGLLGGLGVRDRLPQISQPNLVAPLGQQIAHEAAAEAVAQQGSAAVTDFGGWAF